MWHNISVLPIKEDGLMWIGLSALAAIAVGVVGAWLYRKEKMQGTPIVPTDLTQHYPC